MSADTAGGIRILAENRKARHEYFVEDSLECGISLLGTEVKSMKLVHFSFNDCYAQIENDELYVLGLQIQPYKFSSQQSHEQNRKKKLLAHKAEILKLKRKADDKGYTLIPLKFYLKNGRVKLEIGLCKGKKMFDKRETIKEKDQKRDLARDLRDRF